MLFQVVFFSTLVAVSWGRDFSFPPGFKFGAASAAYQVEGSRNVSDRGESIWDRFLDSDPGLVYDGSNADVACDSYNQYKEDAQLAADIGLHYYRWYPVARNTLSSEYGAHSFFRNRFNTAFDEVYLNYSQPHTSPLLGHGLPLTISEGDWVISTRRPSADCELKNLHTFQKYIRMSWVRLLPTGHPNYISEDGRNYYNNLIDELLANGVEPAITLYHWDLPQTMQDLGGWANPLISDWFAEYAKVVYQLYADRVKTWITINEPMVICDIGYNTGMLAPGVMDPDHTNYQCNKNVLMAHAKAWRIYDEQFKPKYNGRVSIANQLVWIDGKTEEHKELAELVQQYVNGRYFHPIYSKKGGWPSEVEKIIAEKSKKQGLTQSRLPAFTQEEIEFIKGTFDYCGINHYGSIVVEPIPEEEKGVWQSWPYENVSEIGYKQTIPSDLPMAINSPVHPEAIRHSLNWLKKEYGQIDIVITENGYGSKDSSIEDEGRVQYYKRYLEQMLLAIKEDGVSVVSYTAWTLMDNFEWIEGYLTKFGLYAVDFTDPKRTRTPRNSARFFASVINNHSLNLTESA